jgi:hypothetical protein
MPENQVTDPIIEAEEPPRQCISREQVLTRLWEIATMSPEMTRNSATAQVKAISLIVAIEGLIPDRKQKSSAQPLPKANIYRAPWLPKRPGEAEQASPDLAPRIEEPAIPDPTPASVPDSTPSSELNYADSLAPARPNQWVPEASAFASTRDQSVPLSAPKNRFGRRR